MPDRERVPLAGDIGAGEDAAHVLLGLVRDRFLVEEDHPQRQVPPETRIRVRHLKGHVEGGSAVLASGEEHGGVIEPVQDRGGTLPCESVHIDAEVTAGQLLRGMLGVSCGHLRPHFTMASTTTILSSGMSWQPGAKGREDRYAPHGAWNSYSG